jgi:hypothetical protein
VVVLPDQGEDFVECLVSAYAGSPPDVMVFCLRRSELFELACPGMFVPFDVNPKVHLPFWLKHRGLVLHGDDPRGEIPEPASDPALVLEAHLAGWALFLRTTVLGKLLDSTHLALVRELDRQVRYLMATALRVHEEWDVDLETLPAHFARHFTDPALHRSFELLESIRERMEAAAEEESRPLAMEALWAVDSFSRRLRRQLP